MSPPATGLPTQALVRRRYAALRRRLILREGLRAAGHVALLLAASVALGVAWRTGEGPAWARLALTAALALVALGLAVRTFRRARPGFDGYLERIEKTFPAVRSWLRNALDFERRPPEHTSPELARALAAETARRLAEQPLERLAPPLRARRPLAALALALALIVALAVALPARTARSWRALLDPRTAAPPVRLEVEPGSITVSPGVALAVRARVWGTAARPRLLADGARAEATREGEGPAGERVWRFDLAQLTRGLTYRVRVASVESPRFRVALAGTPQPVSFAIELRPPAYAGLPVQRGAATRGDLAALRGSRAVIEVQFDRDLEALEAAVGRAAPRAWQALSPRRWRGAVEVLDAPGYELRARAPGGAGRYRYSIQALPDAPPVLTVRIPQGDLDLPEGQQIPFDVLGQDDLGLTELRLQVRKGAEGPWNERTLARFAGQPREAQVGAHWDAGALGLLPGESASFRFVLLDDDAVGGRNAAVSPTYEVRFPSLAELYQAVDRSHEAVQGTLEQVSQRAQELQKSLDRLARQAPTPATANPRGFEQREEVKSALDRQAELSRRIDEAARTLRESLSEAAERRAFDEQLTSRLKELAQVMDQIQSREFREALRKLQEALQNTQRSAPPNALQDWRRQNEQMLKNIERTLELLKRLRQEERLQGLAQRARELKEAQDARNARMGQERATDSQRQSLAEEQRQAAAQTQQLAGEVQSLGEEMKQEDAAQPLGETAEELQQEATPAQRQAAEQISRSQSPTAQRSGQRASRSLQKAAERLGSMSQSLASQRQQLDLAALRRSAQDLVSVQRAAEASLDARAPASDRGDRQTDLSEGASRVADSLWQLSKQTPFITPQLSQALGRAIQGLQQSGRRFGQGDRPGGEQAGRSASGALVEAVLQLRAAESSMCQNPGASGQPRPGGSIPMQMDRIGNRQAQLNDQTRTLSQRLSEQARLTTGDQEQLRRMADEQARLREELQQVEEQERARQRLLGRLGQTADEMKQVEEALRGGRLGGEVEQKQQHILSRLLDAQRSVNRQDFDPQRESRPGVDVVRTSPGPLPGALLGENDRLRLDLLKSQADRYPAQYRAFIEAYLRSLNAGPGSTR